MNYLKNFLITLVIILLVDFVWLGVVAKGFYNKELISFSRTLRLSGERFLA